MSSFFNEMNEVLGNYRLFWALAWEDLRGRYRRTVFGVLWATLSFALFCAAKIIVFGALSKTSVAFFSVYVVTGFLVWQFMSAAITDGCTVFIAARSWLRGSTLPPLTFILQSVSRLAILNGYSMLAATIIVAIAGYPKSFLALAALPAIPFYLVTAVPVQVLAGTVSTAFRDVAQLISTAVRVVFFVTPIIWVPSELGALGKIAWYNPFTHYIALFRTPILEGVIPWQSWAIAGAVTLLLWGAAIWVYARARYKIIYWL